MSNGIICIGPKALSERGYKTTFYQDFSIAERYGEGAVRETYERAFNEWHTNIEYITEFVVVLNHKIFDLFHSNRALAKVYEELWRKADQWACNNLKDKDLNYYLSITN